MAYPGHEAMLQTGWRMAHLLTPNRRALDQDSQAPIQAPSPPLTSSVTLGLSCLIYKMG